MVLKVSQTIPHHVRKSGGAALSDSVNDQTLGLGKNYDICTVPAMLGHVGIQENTSYIHQWQSCWSKGIHATWGQTTNVSVYKVVDLPLHIKIDSVSCPFLHVGLSPGLCEKKQMTVNLKLLLCQIELISQSILHSCGLQAEEFFFLPLIFKTLDSSLVVMSCYVMFIGSSSDYEVVP